MKDFTTFRTGGSARWFFRVRSLDELKEAVLCAKDKNLPFFVLGGGSNVLVSDDGFPGVVIKMEIGGIDFEESKGGLVRVTAGAGENWDAFVAATVARGLIGLENLSLIPGTVGAAPVQNIGAYGREAKDAIVEVEALDADTGEIKKFSLEECRFGYRDSFFKSNEGKKYVVTRVVFILQRNGIFKTDYKDVQEYFSKNKITDITVADVRNAIVAIRTAKLPDIKVFATAGSFFCNPVLPDVKAEEMIKKYPGIAVYPATEGKKKFAAAWILDHVCGLRGVQNGNVGTYKNQALVIVNHGGATTKEVVEFAESLREQVKNKTGIGLEFEVQIIK